jgi:hypothetical protein
MVSLVAHAILTRYYLFVDVDRADVCLVLRASCHIVWVTLRDRSDRRAFMQNLVPNGSEQTRYRKPFFMSFHKIQRLTL